MFKKIISLILSVSLILTQPVFAQGLAELNIGKYLNQMPAVKVDSFRLAHLRYVSYDMKADSFQLLLDKGDGFNRKTEKPKNPKTSEFLNSSTPKLEETTQELFNYFLIGLSLPNDKFWVNLRPDAPEQIIDPLLEKTDMGRIMLEADLQLKKDTAGLTSPQNPEGKQYWDKLYKKAGELFGTENITIPTITRPWIVPGEVIIRESQDSAYIYKANLKVMLEEDYLTGRGERLFAPTFADPRMKELNRYSTQLIKEFILPRLTQEINTSKKYAQLRQVFFSLILSRWFKDKYQGSSVGNGLKPFPTIDSGDLTNLTSQDPWSKDYYFSEYKKSFQQGEYNLKEQLSTPTGQVIRSYVSGGIEIMGKAGSPIIAGRFRSVGEKLFPYIVGLSTFLLSVGVGEKGIIPQNNQIAKADSFSFYLTMENLAKDIVFENDEEKLESIYRILIRIPLSGPTGKYRMIHLILTNLNNKDGKETEWAYKAIEFLSNNNIPSDWDIDDFFEFINIEFESNFPKTQEKPTVCAFNILTMLLKTVDPVSTTSVNKYRTAMEKCNEWHNKGLKYLRSYRKAKGGHTLNDDPIYNAILNLLRTTATLGLKKEGSSPLAPQEGASSAVVLEEEFVRIKAFIFDKFKELNNPFFSKNKMFSKMLSKIKNTNHNLNISPFTRPINDSKDWRGLIVSADWVLKNASKHLPGQVNLRQLRQDLVNVIKPVGIKLQLELFECINEYVLKNPAVASKLNRILQMIHSEESMFGFPPAERSEVISEVTADMIAFTDKQRAQDFSAKVDAWKVLNDFVLSSSALTQDLPQAADSQLMPGGIDFTRINYLTRPMGSFQGLDLRLPLLSKAELEGIDINKELASVEQMVNARIDVSSDRLKRLLAAMSQKDAFTAQRETQLLPLLLRLCWLKEEKGSETTPDFRAVLLIADTGLFVEQGNTRYALN